MRAEIPTYNDPDGPDAWLFELSNGLTDEYVVVANLVIQRAQISAIVINQKGLIVLHARPWQGHIVPSAIGSWRGQTP
ncbi:MAG: nuclease-related domain-containing protein, partial [Anaerolineae bacterium]